MFLARLKLALGDIAGAAAILAKADQVVRQYNFVHQIPEIAAAQVLTMLHQGNLAVAAHMAEAHNSPISQARVHLAQGDASTALAVLEPLRQQAEANGWEDERLKVMVLQAVALRASGEKDKAIQLLGEALALAEPGGFIRIFIDEGVPMAHLLSEAAARGIKPDYIGKLLAVFESEKQLSLVGRKASSEKGEDRSYLPPAIPDTQGTSNGRGHWDGESLSEPLSQRELEVLQLIALGLSNGEISERLVLSLNTVKGHNQKIFSKLQVQSRTEAIARARELDLL